MGVLMVAPEALDLTNLAQDDAVPCLWKLLEIASNTGNPPMKSGAERDRFERL